MGEEFPPHRPASTVFRATGDDQDATLWCGPGAPRLGLTEELHEGGGVKIRWQSGRGLARAGGKKEWDIILFLSYLISYPPGGQKIVVAGGGVGGVGVDMPGDKQRLRGNPRHHSPMITNSGVPPGGGRGRGLGKWEAMETIIMSNSRGAIPAQSELLCGQ